MVWTSLCEKGQGVSGLKVEGGGKVGMEEGRGNLRLDLEEGVVLVGVGHGV